MVRLQNYFELKVNILLLLYSYLCCWIKLKLWFEKKLILFNGGKMNLWVEYQLNRIKIR